MIGPIQGIDAERGDWERDEWLSRRWDREAAARGEGIRWGLMADQSPATLIPDTITPGALILAPVLSQLAEDYGRDVAFVVDQMSEPCLFCARNTYNAEVCDDCAARLDGDLEQAGTFNPREEW